MLPARPLSVLFLCTGNSCRSQMAEGWARRLHPVVLAPHSAGVESHGLNSLAVQVMAEAGVDISRQRSKTVGELGAATFDAVVTVCDHARSACPVPPPAAVILHAPFADPPALAVSARSEEEALACYRRVRDEIRAFVAALPAQLAVANGGAGKETP